MGGDMKFEINKEYNFRVMLAASNPDVDPINSGRKLVKRVKIVAMPVENEAVIEFIGAKKYYQGLALPVRGRLHMAAGIPDYLFAGNEKYEIMNVIA
jgi:hypothetical protein